MRKFTKANIREIPTESAHGGVGSGQMLVTPEKVTSPYFEAMTQTM